MSGRSPTGHRRANQDCRAVIHLRYRLRGRMSRAELLGLFDPVEIRTIGALRPDLPAICTPTTTCTRDGSSSRAVSRTCASSGLPAISCSTLAWLDRMRLPRPAARTTISRFDVALEMVRTPLLPIRTANAPIIGRDAGNAYARPVFGYGSWSISSGLAVVASGVSTNIGEKLRRHWRLSSNLRISRVIPHNSTQFVTAYRALRPCWSSRPLRSAVRNLSQIDSKNEPLSRCHSSIRHA